MTHLQTIRREIRHFHLFSGIGGGAKGFNMGYARVGAMESVSRCLGGIDVDAPAIRDFEKQAGVRGTVLDLFDRDQYKAFHGTEPPPGWKEATAVDIRRAAGNERPHIVFLSAPCKGFSGLLATSLSLTSKYQALNRLTLRGIWLMLEAWADDPPELVVFENVPLIQTRGKHLLDQIMALLQQYGYVAARTTHDCGEIGGLAQSRKRFLLVARHAAKVPPFLYEPEKKSLRAIGDLLGRMPLPDDPTAGPMHRLPRLQWATWVRLAMVEAGSDWRSLHKLNVADGVLTDFIIVPDGTPHGDFLGVRHWEQSSRALSGRSGPTNGAYAVADPRYRGKEYSQYGVIPFDSSMGAISAQSMPGGGKYAVADPRVVGERHANAYRIVRWSDYGATVTGDFKASGGGGLADPRHGGPAKHSNEYRVSRWSGAAPAVTSAHGTGQCVADPRPQWSDEAHGAKLKVMRYDEAAHTITGARFGSGGLCVADPRGVGGADTAAIGGHAVAQMPAARDHLVARIRALDGTFHRPFTTLELAVLQSLVEPEEHLELEGLSDQAWRERIGNMVPPSAAREIANVMFTTLLLAWAGETFVLSSQKIWVRNVATALAVCVDGH
jgi:site-specific DNA-cytosine methylase